MDIMGRWIKKMGSTVYTPNEERMEYALNLAEKSARERYERVAGMEERPFKIIYGNRHMIVEYPAWRNWPDHDVVLEFPPREIRLFKKGTPPEIKKGRMVLSEDSIAIYLEGDHGARARYFLEGEGGIGWDSVGTTYPIVECDICDWGSSDEIQLDEHTLVVPRGEAAGLIGEIKKKILDRGGDR